MAINTRQVSFGGNFNSLRDMAKKAWVKTLPFVSSQTLTVAGSNVALVDSTKLPGNISLGLTSTYSGGIVAAALPGAVGTGSTVNFSDSLGNIANIISIRDTTTNAPITSGVYEVYALVQAASTVADGDAIGATAAENLQLSFVCFDSSDALNLVSITGTIEFAPRKMITEENLPAYEVQTGVTAPNVMVPAAAKTIHLATYTVTTAFAALENINLVTGAGAVAGVSTAAGDNASVALGASAAVFNANNEVTVAENGVIQVKGTDAIWVSNTALRFAIALDVGDKFTVSYYA